MRICLLADMFPPDVGGLARAVYRHGKHLASAGHEVHALVTTDSLPAGEVRELDEGQMRIHRLGRSHRMCDTLTDWTEQAASLAGRAGCEIFHGYFVAYAGFVAVHAARMTGRHSVVSARGNDLDRLVFDAERAPFVLWALDRADVVTAVSTELCHRIWTMSGRSDAVWVPNSVDAGTFQPVPPGQDLAALRKTLGIHSGAVIGFVGEARLKKGLAVLLRAFARIAPEVGAHLLLVGGVRPKDQPVLDLFRAQHPDLPLHLIPYQSQDELPAYYQLMDLVVFPSFRDGMPNALLEAMACARATISSEVGGIPDVIAHGRNGWLVPPRDEGALVECIRQSLARPDECLRVGLAARETIQDHFTPEREISANLQIYGRLLGHVSG